MALPHLQGLVGHLDSGGGDSPLNGGLALGPALRMRWPQVGHVSFRPSGRRRVSHDKRRFGTPPLCRSPPWMVAAGSGELSRISILRKRRLMVVRYLLFGGSDDAYVALSFTHFSRWRLVRRSSGATRSQPCIGRPRITASSAGVVATRRSDCSGSTRTSAPPWPL